MINRLFLLILSLSLSGSVIMALVFLIKAAVGNRFTKTWQFYIWILVIGRLLIPITLELNVVNSLFDWNNVYEKSETKELPAQANMDSEIEKAELSEEENENFAGGSYAEKIKTPVKNKPFDWEFLFENIWIIWVFGIILSFTVKIVDYRNFHKYVKMNNKEITDPEILAVMDDVMSDLKIRKDITLYSNDLAVSPMLLGGLRPGIVLPLQRISKSQLSYVLMHEVTHYKRGDIWIKWLLQLAICIHWFNPLLLLIKREINRSCELSCDEYVMRRLDENERKSYGNMLLDVANIGIQYKSQVLSMTLVENKKNLKERLASILLYKKSTKWVKFASLLVVFMISISALTVGAMTVEVEQKKDSAKGYIKPQEPIPSEADNSEKTDKSYDMDMFVKMIPYIDESMVDEFLMNALENKLEISDSDLSSIVCFVGDGFSDSLIEFIKSGNEITIEQLVIMSPFLTEKCIDEIIYMAVDNQFEFTKQQLNAILPFASEEALGEIFKSMMDNGETVDIMDLQQMAPFIDSKVLDEYMQNLIDRQEYIPMENIRELANFLDEDVLGDILLYQVKYGNEDILKNLEFLEYAMDSEDIFKVLKEMLDNGMQLTIENIKFFYYGMDDEDVIKILNLMLENHLTTKEEVDNFNRDFDLS